MSGLNLLRLFEAKSRMEKVLERRNKIATEQFVRCVIDLGHAQGFDLANGDKCFIHPGDLPPSVRLNESHPVIASRAIAMVQGQLYFTKATALRSGALDAPPIFSHKAPLQ